MPITKGDVQDADIRFKRIIRTNQSESYNISTDKSSVGVGDSRPYQVGEVIIQYVPVQLSKTRVYGVLLMRANWEEAAIDVLHSRIESDIISSIGITSGHTNRNKRENVIMYTYRIEEQLDIVGDMIQDDSERGIYGVVNQIKQNRDQIDALPEEVSKSIDEVVNEHYEEIAEIVEGNMSEEEKKAKLKDNLRVGLERGLPTLLWEN